MQSTESTELLAMVTDDGTDVSRSVKQKGEDVDPEEWKQLADATAVAASVAMHQLSFDVVGVGDAQTYMARFESMRNSVQGRRNRKVFVVHKELERQCRNAIRSQQFTSRMNEAELKRERDRVQDRLDRIQSEQSRMKRESARRQSELDSEEKAHADRRRALEEADRATRHQQQQLKDGGGGTTAEDQEQIIERIGRMALPTSVKQRLQMHIVSSFASVYTAAPPVDGGEGQLEGGRVDDRPKEDDAKQGQEDQQHDPAL